MIQPWASLFVLGETQYETRTWKTNYRGTLAIHTSKKVDRDSCSHPNILELLAKHGYTASNLPTGVIIGTCILKNCIKVAENHNTWALLEDGRLVEGNDFFLGDYRVGGYVWEVENKKLLEEFLPAKGQLGIWKYNEDSQNSPK